MENGLVNVANGLPAEEFETYVACLDRGGAFVPRLPRPENVFVLGKPAGFSPATVVRLARLIRRLRPHVIHSHNSGPLIYAALATGGGWWRPLLQGEHGQLTAAEQAPRRLATRRLLYRACACVHTVSEGLQEHLREQGLRARRMVSIINGVDVARFQPGDRAAVRAQLGLPAGGLVLGMVGRFCRNKRHDLLLSAFERVRARIPSATLLVVGEGGPDREAIQAAYERSPARSGIVLAGFQADPRRHYQAMDLLVAPSSHEGLSNVVLEAMASGVPVLAHAACGNREVITNGVDGFMGEFATPAELAERLFTLLADPAGLTTAGTRARRKIEERFSLARMVADYAREYRLLAAPG